jgi:hypothetical protein
MLHSLDTVRLDTSLYEITTCKPTDFDSCRKRYGYKSRNHMDHFTGSLHIVYLYQAITLLYIEYVRLKK